MTWIRLDDALADHPKLRAVGPRAAWLYVAALCYCSRYLTDGFVPENALAGMGGLLDARRLARSVASSGLWASEGTGYRIPDYLDFNPSRQEVEAKRAKERRRKAGQGDGTVPRNPAPSDGPPAPIPPPLGVGVDLAPDTQVAKGKSRSPSDGSSNGKPKFGIDAHQEGLLLRLWEERPSWADGPGAISHAGLVKLMKEHGVRAVNEALEDLVDHAGQVRRPFPYLEKVARERADAVVKGR